MKMSTKLFKALIRKEIKRTILKEDSPTYKESLYDVYKKLDKDDHPAFWEYLEELVEKEHGTVSDFTYEFLIGRK